MRADILSSPYSHTDLPTEAHKPLELLRLKDVCKRTKWSKSTIYKLISENRFPRQLHTRYSRASFWDAGAIDRYISTIIADSNSTNCDGGAR